MHKLYNIDKTCRKDNIHAKKEFSTILNYSVTNDFRRFLNGCFKTPNTPMQAQLNPNIYNCADYCVLIIMRTTMEE